MRNIISRLFKDEKGGSNLLSAAAILPLLTLMIAAIVQITLLVNAKMTVREAAFEALRYGVKSDTPVVVATDTAYKYSGLPGWVSGGNLTVYAYTSGATLDKVLNVEVKYKVPVINSSLFGGSGGFATVTSGLIKRRLEDSL